MVDGVELVLLEKAKHVRAFDRQQSIWFSEYPRPGDEIVEGRNLG